MALGDVYTENVKKSSFLTGLGIGYDLSSNVSARLTYATQLTNSSKVDGLILKAIGIGL
jgi:opacity protein-like surface antigen